MADEPRPRGWRGGECSSKNNQAPKSSSYREALFGSNRVSPSCMGFKMAFVLAGLGLRQAAGFVRPAPTAGRWGLTRAASATASPPAPKVTKDDPRFTNGHPNNNIPPHIAALVGRDLHLLPNHPIYIIRKKIQDYFASLDTEFTIFNGAPRRLAEWNPRLLSIHPYPCPRVFDSSKFGRRALR